MAVFLGKSFYSQRRKPHPRGGQDAAGLSHGHAQTANGNGVGRGTPLQIDVMACIKCPVELSVLRPSPVLLYDAEAALPARVAHRYVSAPCVPGEVTKNFVSCLRGFTTRERENRTPKRPPLSRLEQFETLEPCCGNP